MRRSGWIRGLALLLGCVAVVSVVAACQRAADTAPSPGASPAAEASAPAAEPAPQPIEPAADPESGAVVELGLRAGPDRKVADPMLSFAPGDPVCVSIALPQGASGARAEASWFDANDAELGRAGAALEGSPPRAAWCLPGAERLATGSYRLELAVDGTPRSSLQISVTDAREPARHGGGS